MADTAPSRPGSAAWWEDRVERDARTRPRADGLTLTRIVEVALALVDCEGLDALTVRRLATDLETGSASLYRHIASRDELLVLMVDHVLGEIVFPVESLSGSARVAGLATELLLASAYHLTDRMADFAAFRRPLSESPFTA
jgi:AcrR family transcriptional regulator